MAGGELIIDGDAGDRVGAGMTGGLGGRARQRAATTPALAMGGGVLRIAGNAGDRLGAAAPGASKGMTGGEIVVGGSAGSEAAARARRGLVVVGGDAGSYAGAGDDRGHAGRARPHGRRARPSEQARIHHRASAGSTCPITYWHACTFQPPHVRLTMTYLRRRYGLADRRPCRRRRSTGATAATPGDRGRGEILEWAGQ